MNAVALRQDFDRALAGFSPAPPLAAISTNAGSGVRERFDREFGVALTKLHHWRSEMLQKLTRLEAIFSEAQSTEPDDVRSLILELPRAYEGLSRAISDAEIGLALPSEMKAMLDVIETVKPSLASTARHIERSYEKAAKERLSYLYDMRDRLKQIEWDYDPDARGGPAFAKADDLLSFLRS